jgi:hypothetical protein
MDVYNLCITFASIFNRTMMILIMFNSVPSVEVSLVFMHVKCVSFRWIHEARVQNFRSLQALSIDEPQDDSEPLQRPVLRVHKRHTSPQTA